MTFPSISTTLLDTLMTSILRLAPESISLLNWALRHERHAIVVLGSSLQDAVPVERHLHALHMVLDVDDDAIVLAHLDARAGDHSVGGEDAALDAIGEHALAVTPHGVGGIRRAHLAGAVKGDERWTMLIGI